MYPSKFKKQSAVAILLSLVLAVLGIGTWTSTTSFAADFQFSGPAAGYVNVESAVFTVTTGGGFNGNIRVQIEGAGLDATEVLNFKGSDLLQSFTITPTQIGTVTLTARSQTGNPQENAITYVVGSGPTPTPTPTPTGPTPTPTSTPTPTPTSTPTSTPTPTPSPSPTPTATGIATEAVWLNYDNLGRVEASWLDTSNVPQSSGLIYGIPYATSSMFTGLCISTDSLIIKYGTSYRTATCGSPDPRTISYQIDVTTNINGEYNFNYLDPFGVSRTASGNGLPSTTVYGVACGYSIVSAARGSPTISSRLC